MNTETLRDFWVLFSGLLLYYIRDISSAYFFSKVVVCSCPRVLVRSAIHVQRKEPALYEIYFSQTTKGKPDYIV